MVFLHNYLNLFDFFFPKTAASCLLDALDFEQLDVSVVPDGWVNIPLNAKQTFTIKFTEARILHNEVINHILKISEHSYIKFRSIKYYLQMQIQKYYNYRLSTDLLCYKKIILFS